jgi:hypothetical protein
MSTLHINQIATKIRELFETKIDLSDVGKEDKGGRDEKILSRCLAAYAIYSLADCSSEDAALSVVDGSNDNGIDAIYYSEELRKLFIVQSKWSKKGKGEPSKGDLLKFHAGIRKLFNLELDEFNEKIQKRKDLIISIINDFNIKFEVVLIDTHEKQDLEESNTKEIMKFISELSDDGSEESAPLVNFIRLNQSDIHMSLRQMNYNKINMELGLNNWGMITTDFDGVTLKAYYGTVEASEIAGWWKEFGDKAFERNIRKILGKTDVNNELERTLQEKPSLFWYFNNGITIVADKIEKTKAGGSARNIGNFKLTDFSIINGAQTVSSIGRYQDRNIENSNLDKAQVYVRIIEISENIELAKTITRANNRQNRIENMDFASQDPIQQRIKNELILEDIEYSIMRSDGFKPSPKAFNLQDATIALTVASGDISLVVQAKNAIGKFFENLEGGIYKKIFNDSVTGYHVYNAVIFIREVEKILSKKVDNLGKKQGKVYGILIHGNRIISYFLYKKLNIQNSLEDKNFSIEKNQLSKEVDEIVKVIECFIKNNYPENVLSTFFKNATKCKELDIYACQNLSI